MEPLGQRGPVGDRPSMGGSREPCRLLVVDASPQPTGRVANAALAALGTARDPTSGVEAESIHLSGGEWDASRVASADALLIVCPVYRATYPGSVKDLLDAVPVQALAHKVMGWVAVGATLHHYLGVDAALRGVAAWFGCLAVPTSVYLSHADFDPDKNLSGEATREVAALVTTMARLSTLLRGERFEPLPLAMR